MQTRSRRPSSSSQPNRRTDARLPRLFVGLVAFALGLTAFAATDSAHAQEGFRFADAERVVVVGDVHGAYAALVGLLEATGLIDAELQWTGGSAHLVSLGDLLDRGPDARKVLDLLMALEPAAAARGGRVHVVLGNHELMNLIGDWRYVTAADYAAFAAEEPPAMRAAAYSDFLAEQAGSTDDAATRARFDAAYPPGYFARAAAFAANGRYGAWLLERPVLIVINDTAYVHGGLPSLVAATTLDALNARTHRDIERYLELRTELAAAGALPTETMEHDHAAATTALETATDLKPALEEFLQLADAPELGVDGPLWYRGSVYCRPLVEQPKLTAGLAALGAERVVVGHTPTADRRVRSLYDGKLIMLDTGMLADYYAGRPAALVEETGAEYVQYLGPEQRAPVERAALPEAYGLTGADLLDALTRDTAAVTARSDGAPWTVTLAHGNQSLGAAFYPAGRDGAADRELAAAMLDDRLETELIPPTVARTIEGTPGTLQLRYGDGISEAERQRRGIGFPGSCPLEPQLDLMYLFDVLTMNRGRTAENVIYHRDLSQLSIVDFAEAFGDERRLPMRFDPATLALPQALLANLAALDESSLETLLGNRLDKRQIRALLARRDALLEAR
jgi:Calcineurin-like phosphoesterase